ncbi:hypothetical protein M0P48_04820 [Candidatus Gracilibacteria bacterium]|jgi:CxxC-x17-CxxC domain-containing protein|nr:hypothetical protein [Candidatus Gracilibacteria bacterium]
MEKACKNCNHQFEITDEDLAFYDRVSSLFSDKKYNIPSPTLCPDCRQQRRLSFRNERNLYRRKSDLGGKEVVTMYSPESKYLVYDQNEWWGESFDPLKYGKDFSFDKPFFEQFQELMMAVPRISLINKEPENSEYCNFAFRNKDSYLLFTAGENDGCSYSNRILKSRDTLDSSNITNCELCYSAVDSENSYNCAFVKNCSNCSDCILGQNLRGCKNCFASFGLANKQYCIGNIQYEKEEYERRVKPFLENLPKSKEDYFKWLNKIPRRYMEATNAENCTGDNIYNSKNAKECYEVKELQDCKFVSNATSLKDCYDINNDDNSELVYECIGSEKNYMHTFNDICWFNSEISYCSLCFNSKNCFGCVGLKKNQYCILNKQYTKEQYEELVPKIIEHMIKNMEWGEFFPMNISPFSYNESMAQDYFPLSKENVTSMGLKWREDKEETPKTGYKLPDFAKDAKDDICKQILVCEASGKAYKIVPSELNFYKKTNLPLPKKCPNQRHKERMALRNPRKLYDRKCDKCGTEITTTYNPKQTETVYCEKCYLDTVS